MATPITINVTNNSPNTQNFFFFQQPAKYMGGATVYSNSLYTQTLLPYSSSGSVLTFNVLLQYYAGVQQQTSPPQVGQPSGYVSASQPIDLTSAPGGSPTKNTTTMTASPLGLSPPFNTSGPEVGSFRIQIPTFNPTLANYNAGSAVQQVNGGIVLSNFVTAQSTTNLDCQPIIIFYVQTGTYTAGTVMNFTASSSNAAVCDFTPGYAVYNVSYNANGTWTATPFVSLVVAGGERRLIAASATINATVKNEAGTAVLSTGHAADGDSPVIIENLSQPDEIVVLREYQIGLTNGANGSGLTNGSSFVGRMCIEKRGNTAIFS
jgi:hypothetical protein